MDGQVGTGPSVGAGGKAKDLKAGGPGLYMIEPSGLYWVGIQHILSLIDSMRVDTNQLDFIQGYYGAATGKGRQAAKAELEKLDLPAGNLSLLDGVKEAARIIYVAHEEDKDFELEMTWISSLDGPTKGRHEEVPRELLEEAEKAAKAALEGEDEEEEEKTGEGEQMEE